MRDKIILLLFVVCSLLGAFSYVLWRRVRSVASERDDYAMVAKAYASACEDSEGESRVFRLRIGELTASSDSLMRRMDSLRREIGVRDKRLRAIHYHETVVRDEGVQERGDCGVRSKYIFSINLLYLRSKNFSRTIRNKIPSSALYEEKSNG